MAQVELNNQQARELARAFIGDIEGYVQQHLSEYQMFLKSEGYPESEVKHDDLK